MKGLLIFLIFAFTEASISLRRCSFMRDLYLTDRPPFNGNNVTCMFDYTFNTYELQETARLLNGTLSYCKLCRECREVIIPQLKICNMGKDQPQFCKDIKQKAESCKYVNMNAVSEIVIKI